MKLDTLDSASYREANPDFIPSEHRLPNEIWVNRDEVILPSKQGFPYHYKVVDTFGDDTLNVQLLTEGKVIMTDIFDVSNRSELLKKRPQ